jgi:hypothetical protein
MLFGLGHALGARAQHQRAADLAAISAAQVMRRNYARLFGPPSSSPTFRARRHLEGAERPTTRGRRDLGGTGFAPTRVTVRVRAAPRVRAGSGRHAVGRVPVRTRATAELMPDAAGAGLPDHASGGGYDGPLAYRQGKPMRRTSRSPSTA